MATVAVLGTGIMGGPIARRLAAAGHAVRAWNRTRERAEALADAGVRPAESPVTAVRGADAVVTMLADAAAVEDVVVAAGALDAMPAGTLWLQMGTIGVEPTDRLAADAARRGVVFVDAPVLGSKPQAEEGQLLALASGPPEARARTERLLEPAASEVRWLGGAGLGSRLKLLANSWLLCTVENLAETLALAEQLGVEPHRFLELIRGTQFDMAYAQRKGDLMLRRQFAATFPLRLARKDLALALDAAGGGLDLPVVGAVLGQFERAVALGHGDADSSAVFLGLSAARPGTRGSMSEDTITCPACGAKVSAEDARAKGEGDEASALTCPTCGAGFDRDGNLVHEPAIGP